MCKKIGLDIIKQETNKNLGIRVALTRKTTKSGNIRHAVVITDRRGIHTRLKSFLGISGAWNLYKTMLNA